jgi:hypothetical protein
VNNPQVSKIYKDEAWEIQKSGMSDGVINLLGVLELLPFFNT